MFTVSASSSQSADVVQNRSTTPRRTAAATATTISDWGRRPGMSGELRAADASGGRGTVRTSATSIGSKVIERRTGRGPSGGGAVGCGELECEPDGAIRAGRHHDGVDLAAVPA